METKFQVSEYGWSCLSLGVVCVSVSTWQWVGFGPGSSLIRVIFDWEWFVCPSAPASVWGVGLGVVSE